MDCGLAEPGLEDLKLKPSIEFLELYALCTAIFTWQSHPKLVNTRIIIFCDNQVVVSMINNTALSCGACMKLIHLLVLNGLQFNRRVSVKYVKSADNILADSLSRQKWSTFWEYAPASTRQIPDEVPDWLFPVEKFLIEN